MRYTIQTAYLSVERKFIKLRNKRATTFTNPIVTAKVVFLASDGILFGMCFETLQIGQARQMTWQLHRRFVISLKLHTKRSYLCFKIMFLMAWCPFPYYWFFWTVITCVISKYFDEFSFSLCIVLTLYRALTRPETIVPEVSYFQLSL